eukprot:CAMPEP_0171443132 /NCGR_PEP_ID=MMETSP0881-20121228/30158_1 /TAXON_ID=67004 /ORGANISM="Thalassiosira weissflogii, Strain CCMP1336" /LENGTH=71 /DNA_ID=CAMNT_0011966467 /DNA_START=1 /DNA_END=213 /DNA_ORIENTATION=+
MKLVAVSLFSVVSFGLSGYVWGKGFRAVEPDVTVEHSKSHKGSKRSSRKKSRGDQISSNCLMDVRLQDEGE